MAKRNATGARTTVPSTAEERAYADRQDTLVAFLANPPPELLVAADAVGRVRDAYGDDTARELADIEAGRHPLQKRRAKTAPR